MRQATAITTPVNIEERRALEVRPGDTIVVHQKIKEKNGKIRIQKFEGMVLARKHGKEAGATITVRRVLGGYGVEKIFPLYSPHIDKIEVIKRSKVRRAKLYYVREKAVKELSKRMKMELLRSDEKTASFSEASKEDVSDKTKDTSGESHPEKKPE